jgi:hypothetical protein
VSGLCEKTINYVVTLVSLVSGFPYKLRLAFAPCRWIIVWQKQRANKVVMSTTPFIIIPIYLYCTHRRTTSDNRPPAQLLSRLSLYPNPRRVGVPNRKAFARDLNGFSQCFPALFSHCHVTCLLYSILFCIPPSLSAFRNFSLSTFLVDQ